MNAEIQKLVDLLGITELQAYRHVKARRELLARGNSRIFSDRK